MKLTCRDFLITEKWKQKEIDLTLTESAIHCVTDPYFKHASVWTNLLDNAVKYLDSVHLTIDILK